MDVAPGPLEGFGVVKPRSTGGDRRVGQTQRAMNISDLIVMLSLVPPGQYGLGLFEHLASFRMSFDIFLQGGHSIVSQDQLYRSPHDLV